MSLAQGGCFFMLINVQHPRYKLLLLLLLIATTTGDTKSATFHTILLFLSLHKCIFFFTYRILLMHTNVFLHLRGYHCIRCWERRKPSILCFYHILLAQCVSVLPATQYTLMENFHNTYNYFHFD